MATDSYHIVVLGGGGVGKSALTIQLTSSQFNPEYDPTIEDSYRKQTKVDGEPCVLEIVDTAGQEDYAAMRDQYIQVGEGFLIVYTITERDSFSEVEKFYEKVQEVKDCEKPAVVVAGNKSDLQDMRKVTTQEGQDMCNKWGCPFIETSAKNRVNVEEAFYDVVRAIKKSKGIASGNNGGKEEKKGCCVIA